MRFLLSAVFLLVSALSFAQNGVIKGRVFDIISNEPVPFANVVIQGTTTGSSTDIDGKYAIEALEPGLYNLEVSFVGFANKVIYEVQVTNARPAIVDFALESSATEIGEVEVTAEVFSKTEESPVSMRTIGVSEIERNPGGNRDISKVIQSLPGVASTASFRNDIIIRGGAPNENRFFLDGIEVPNINHFATQGSSGGPVGMINVNFIREVDFFSGAFPANRGNAMSSVFSFKQKEGNPDKVITNITVGSSDVGLTFDGPVGEKGTFIFSVRRSYLQFLFAALNLPFLPTYNDSQFKYKIKLDKRNQITFVGLGAFDDFVLNQEAVVGVSDTAVLERNQYFLGVIPEQRQWNYTIGANYQHFNDQSYQTFVVSRNHLSNQSKKYLNNDDTDVANLLLDYISEEIENKFRFEHTLRVDGWKLNAGVGYEHAIYKNSTFNRISVPGAGIVNIDFDSKLNVNKYAAFGQLSRTLSAGRYVLSLGVRTDFNDYASTMSNPIDQLSPRFSAAWNVNDRFSVNANVGRYYQLPAYTVMGYRDNAGSLVNQLNGLKYIQSDHLVAGVEYRSPKNTRYTLEGFHKAYEQYPFLTNDSISLANLGADFGVIGNAPATSTSVGRSYGVEFMAQRKLLGGFFGVVAYTWVRSEFEDKNGDLVPSAWDNQHIVALTGGYKWGKNWEVGVKLRYYGGAPYTPYDENASSLITNWEVTQTGILDYDRLNENRLAAFYQLDFRIDKKWFFEKSSLNLYLDVQNATSAIADQPDILNVRRDANGLPLVDPNDPGRYQTYFIDGSSGNSIPALGIIFEF